MADLPGGYAGGDNLPLPAGRHQLVVFIITSVGMSVL